MALLHFELNLVSFGNLLLHIGDVSEDAVPGIRVTDEAETLVRVEHGYDTTTGLVNGLHILILGDTNLDVFQVDFFAFRRIGRGINNAAKLIHVSKHFWAIKRALVSLGLLLLEVLFLLLLSALRFSFALPECFLRSSQIVDFAANVEPSCAFAATWANCFPPFRPENAMQSLFNGYNTPRLPPEFNGTVGPQSMKRLCKWGIG